MADIRFDNGAEVTSVEGDERIPCIVDPGSTPVDGWINADRFLRSKVTSVASVSGVVTLDWSQGDYFTLELDENVSSWVVTNPPGSGRGFTLMVEGTQDSMPRTVAKPGTAPGGTFDVPTGSGAKFLIAITSFDNGATLRSNVSADSYS